MANIHLIFPLLFISCFIFPSTTNGYSNAIIKAWCTQTPHPQPCEYFLSQNPKITSPIVKKSDFLKVSLDLVLDRALRAQLNTYSLGPKCRNEREKNAWADCIELYENSINKIKSTVDPNTKCSATDAQTWLSTALTNLETCKAGFEELGVTDYVMPLMSNNNVSSLISNALALNHGYYTEPTKSSTSTQVDGFPTWVSPGDRKLLQSSSSSTASQANVVVATDGSGDFKTVKEAVDAAAKNKGSGRFVIYVKAGTYNENVEIGEKVKNVMLIGDGIGKTIITGSKSVGGGSTTFRSATVGKYTLTQSNNLILIVKEKLYATIIDITKYFRKK